MPHREPGPTVRNALERLEKVKPEAGAWMARCPAHPDFKSANGRRSLSVKEAQDGRVLFHCFAGCTTRQIVAAIGMQWSDLFPESARRDNAAALGGSAAGLRAAAPAVALSSNGTGRPSTGPVALADDEEDDPAAWPVVAEYNYVDPDGALVFQVQRKEPHLQPEAATEKRRKEFRQRRPDGPDRWVHNLKDLAAPRPLYHLPAVVEAIEAERRILIAEGEKDADRLAALGYTATCHAGGSAAWAAFADDYVAQLRGAGDVVVLIDDDEPGRKWAEQVARSLTAAGVPVRLLALPSTGRTGSDVSDWLAAGGTPEELDRVLAHLAAQRPWAPGDPVPHPPRPSRFRVYTDAELEALPPIEWLAEQMLPAGGLSAVYGAPSSGKSFLTLDLLCHVATGRPWMGRPTTRGGALYVMAEGGRGAAQRVTAWKHHHGLAGQALGVGFVTEPANLMDADDVGHVVAAAAQLPMPPALIVFDTMHRSMPGGDENSSKDLGFVIEHCAQIQRATGAAVMLVHHSRKESDLERGSTSLRGAVDTLLLVRVEDEVRTLVCEKQKDAGAFEAIPLELRPVLDSCVMLVGDPATAGPGEGHKLSARQWEALRALQNNFLAHEGASTTEWMKTSRIPEGTFFHARKVLVELGLVEQAKRGAAQRNTLTSAGREALETGALPGSLISPALTSQSTSSHLSREGAAPTPRPPTPPLRGARGQGQGGVRGAARSGRDLAAESDHDAEDDGGEEWSL